MFESLGHYKILDRIGAGSSGELFRARDTRLGRTVAIRVLSDAFAGDDQHRGRLKNEARALVALSHPSIAALYEVGEEQGHLFLVFEFIPGQTLTTVIGGRPLNARRAVEVAGELADAVADAHAHGIVHGHIRPEHIIVTPKGHAKLLGFGLSTWRGSENRMQAIGAPDPQTDIVAVGGVLFEMITGRRPSADSPVAPSSVLKGVLREIDAVVLKALAKNPAEGYESAVTFAADLRALADVLSVRSEPTAPPPIPVAAASSGQPWIKWLVAILLLGAGLAALFEWIGR